MAASLPIFRVPLLRCCTKNPSIVPSTSALLPFASKSATVISTAVSSAVVATGLLLLVNVGSSLTGIIVIGCTCMVDAPWLSLTVSVMLRSSIDGVSLLLLNIMARPTLCTSSLVACSLRENVHPVPLLTEAALAVPIWIDPAISLLPLTSSQMPLLPGLVVVMLRLSAVSALAVI